MIDLLKKSHERYAVGFYTRITDPKISLLRRNLYLDMANTEEMHGNPGQADQLRRLALGLRPRMVGG